MKRAWFVSGTIVLISVIVVGFTLTQLTPPLLTAYAQGPTEKPKAEKTLVIAVERNINGEVTSGEVQVRFEDPDNLPEEAESAFGLFLNREGEVISLGTGSIEVEVGVEIKNDEEPIRTVSVSHSGDLVGIMMTPDTMIYADITPKPEISDADLESGSKLVTRMIVPGFLEAIEQGMILRVWGPVQDGVITAEVVMCELIDL